MEIVLNHDYVYYVLVHIYMLQALLCFCVVLVVELLNSFLNRGMLSNAVHPPTTEHVYAQWQEREELSSRAPLGILQDDNRQSLIVKEEEAVSPMSGELINQNYFKTSRAVRHKFKGNSVNRGGLEIELATLFFLCSVWPPVS